MFQTLPRSKRLKELDLKELSRFLKYRNLLGGFKSVNQLKEVYSINDSLFESIKYFLIIKDSSLKQININLCSIKDLNRHPYKNGILLIQLSIIEINMGYTIL